VASDRSNPSTGLPLAVDALVQLGRSPESVSDGFDPSWRGRLRKELAARDLASSDPERPIRSLVESCASYHVREVDGSRLTFTASTRTWAWHGTGPAVVLACLNRASQH
jgi:hypothetical protein